MKIKSQEALTPVSTAKPTSDLPIGQVIEHFKKTETGNGIQDGVAVAELLSRLSLNNAQQLLALVQYGREVYSGSRKTKLSACFKGILKLFPRRNECIPYLTELVPIAYRYLQAALTECERKRVQPKEALALRGLKKKDR